MKELSLLELKSLLEDKKEKFSKFRISNGSVTKMDIELSETTYNDIIPEKEEATVPPIPVQEKANISKELVEGELPAEDTIKATKTYSEKIKVGYFGKRRSRF